MEATGPSDPPPSIARPLPRREVEELPPEPEPRPAREQPLDPGPVGAGGMEKGPRLMVFRQSQVVVAAVGTALTVILVFLLGLAAGSPGPSDAPAPLGVRIWGIRVITYNDT